MSHDTVLLGLLKKTFGLLLENEDVGRNCELLEDKLHVRICQIRDGGMKNLMTGLFNLKDAVASLLVCANTLKHTEERTFVSSSNESKEVPESDIENKTDKPEETNSSSEITGRELDDLNAETELSVRDIPKQPRVNNLQDEQLSLYTANHDQLQNELLEIATSDEFQQAMKSFLASKKTLSKVFDDKLTRITATKALVISEILGNLTNVTAAAKNCIDYITHLHEILELRRPPFSIWHKTLSWFRLEKKFQFQEMEIINSIMCVDLVVFHLMKEFFRRPVAMLHWPVIDVFSREEYQETYHPILGNPSAKTDAPDPFTLINTAELRIISKVSAINCNGEIFAKGVLAEEKSQIGIIRIPSKRRYDLEDGTNILSISIDCADCQTPNEHSSLSGEASSCSIQSNTATSCEASFSLVDTACQKACQGKMYILAWHKSDGRIQFLLYVTDMSGISERTDKLRFLKKTATDWSQPQAKVFCIKEEKVVILDVTERCIHIYDTNCKVLKATIDITEQLKKTDTTVTPPIFISYTGEIFCPETGSNLKVYNVDEENSSLIPTSEITLKRVPQAIAFNQELNEVIILCHSAIFLQYHLVTYAKNGELKQDITLHNSIADKKAGFISHPNGSIVLLDNYRLLYLKMASSVRQEKDST